MKRVIALLALLLFVPSMAITADMQAERKQFINQLIEQSVFTKVSVPGKLPRAYVGPAFHRLTFDRKQLFVSVVYAYFYSCKTPGCKDSPDGMVVVYDGMSGKKIGTFTVSPKYGGPGLHLD